jgi:hypothetical protein
MMVFVTNQEIVATGAGEIWVCIGRRVTHATGETRIVVRKTKWCLITYLMYADLAQPEMRA